jgi:multiple sugar transport system substrate-binding protein
MSRRSFLVRSGQIAAGAGLTGTFLASCGGTSTSSSGPVTLTYGWWSNDPTHDNAMRDWLKSFESSHSGIKIKPEILPWGNYWDKVKTTTAAGNAYDIIGMAGGNAPPYFDKGVLYDLSQFSDYQDTAKNLSQGIVQTTIWNGKPYALPVGIYIPTLGYNKDLLKAAGIPLLDPVTPITFEYFKEIGKKLTKKQGNSYVQYALHPAYFIDPDTFVSLEGGSVYDHLINPTKITINTPEGIKGLEDYLSLFTENIAVPYDQQTNGPWGSGDLPSLQTGKIAFARTGAFFFKQIQQSSPNISMAPLFSLNGRRTVFGGANNYSIYRGTKHPNEAWEFLKWATQTQPQLDFAKFSDLPVNNDAFSKLDTALSPKEFIPTLRSNLSAFKPSVMTTNLQISTVFGDIITDMIHGKITPAQAAAQMEQKGNAALASS